jgi:hypothetical protein
MIGEIMWTMIGEIILTMIGEIMWTMIGRWQVIGRLLLNWLRDRGNGWLCRSHSRSRNGSWPLPDRGPAFMAFGTQRQCRKIRKNGKTCRKRRGKSLRAKHGGQRIACFGGGACRHEVVEGLFQVNGVALERTKVLAQRTCYGIFQCALARYFYFGCLRWRPLRWRPPHFGFLHFDQDFRPNIACPSDYGNATQEVSTNIQANVTHQTASFTRLLRYVGQIT